MVNTTPRWHFGEAHVNLRTQTEEEWIDDMNKEFSQLSHKVWQGFALQKCGWGALAKRAYFLCHSLQNLHILVWDVRLGVQVEWPSI